MQQILNIAWKDILLNFRDRSGLLLMLVAPFALILVMGAAFGGFSDNSGPTIEKIPIVVVNLDEGDFSAYIIEAFESDDLVELIEKVEMTDSTKAKASVDNDEFAAAVIIPENFSESIYPEELANMQGNQDYSNVEVTVETSTVEVYRNPSRPISAGVVRSIIDTILNGFTSGRLSAEISIGTMIQSGQITPEQAMTMGESLGRESVENTVDSENTRIQLVKEQLQGEQNNNGFDWLAYYVPSMAVLYLMFAMNAAGRSILEERTEGTLPRMLISPTSGAAVIGGKMLGAFITGVLQMAIVIFGGTLLYGIQWGNSGGMILLTLAVVAAATGWSMIIAAFSKTPGQANAIGTAITLTFAAAAGNFVPRSALPKWLQYGSLISPNGWALDGYTNLGAGLGFESILPQIIALIVMAAILFVISALIFQRQYQ